MIARFGEGAWAAFPRAVGPFTQPVNGHYFVLPLVLAVALFYQLINQGRRLPAAATAIFGLFVGGRRGHADIARQLDGGGPGRPGLPA